MLSGINHITLAVSDLSVSFDFYVGTLSFTPEAKWASGAYLSSGGFWLCLALDRPAAGNDYTHYAFSVPGEAFDAFAERLRSLGITEWKINKSEGKSVYFLDPDGHKLEIHDGDLKSRLRACLAEPYEGMEFY